MKKNSPQDEAMIRLYEETKDSFYKLSKSINNFPTKWGLSFNALMLLDYLYVHNDHAEASEAADELGIPRQTMTALLDGLEKKGVLARFPHPNDRRRKVIRLTPEGFEKVGRLKCENLATEIAALKQMGERDIRMLFKLAMKFDACLEQASRAYNGPVTTF